MNNAFAVLELPCSLHLSPEQVDEAWRSKSKAAHPDSDPLSSSDDDSANLNEARQTLLDPARRLGHWLEIKGIQPPASSTLDDDSMNLFSQIGEAIRSADKAIEKQKSASTALGKAVVAGEAIAAQLAVQNQLGTIHSKISETENRFQDIEDLAEKGEFDLAVTLLNKLRFFKKWETECQKRLLELIAI